MIRLNRRTFLKRILGSAVALFSVGGTYYYAHEIEPATLQITNELITLQNIPTPFNDFKIIQFSDTHVGFQYSFTQLKKLVKTINDQNPDLIVFTGDLIDEPQTFQSSQQLIETLQQLRANHGKFWIYGNHDHGGYGTDMVKDIMDQAGFQLLKNDHVNIELENESITLAGVDDLILGSPDLKSTLINSNPEQFTLLLAHEPDFADTAMSSFVDVQLSGHSHGGQVRFPFIGHLYTPIYAEKYIQGKYELNNGEFLLYVNRGIGTTRLPFRFLCKPEIHIFTLQTI